MGTGGKSCIPPSVEILISYEILAALLLSPPLFAFACQSASDISGSALDKSDPIAIEAVDIFLAIIGAEAGAMALRCLAKGAQTLLCPYVLLKTCGMEAEGGY